MVWVSPINYMDFYGTWEDEPKCYDEDVETYAYNFYGGRAIIGYGGILGLLLASAIPCDKIRFWFSATGDAEIKVEVRRDGVWFTAFEGSAPQNEWVEKSFVQGQVDAVKLNISATGTQPKRYLYEFDFWEVPPFVGYAYRNGLVCVQT